MNCDDVAGQLLPYIDDALSEAEAETVRIHLESCSSCREEHAAEVELCRALDASTSGLAGPGFAEAVMRELEVADQPVSGAVIQFTPWARWTLAPMAVAAAILLAILGARGGEAGPQHDGVARAYDGAATWGTDIAAFGTALAESSAHGYEAVASTIATQHGELGSLVEVTTVIAALLCAALVAKFRASPIQEPRT